MQDEDLFSLSGSELKKMRLKAQMVFQDPSPLSTPGKGSKT